MNNNENNTTNNGQFNSVSLGSYTPETNPQPTPEPVVNSNNMANSNMNVNPNNIQPVQPLTEETESAMLNMNGINPPMDNNTPDNLSPVSPIPMESNPSLNNIPDSINTNPFNNEIGTVPPITNNPIPPVYNTSNPQQPNAPKKKGGINKLIFVIIIVLALTAVGVGVYIFLHISNNENILNPVTVTPKKVEIELGSKISTDINEYAEFQNISSSSCTLDTTNIKDTNTFGAKYKFIITCNNNKTYEGEATIVDKTKPEVKTKNVSININGTVSPLDFIDSCEDDTKCSYAFKDEKTVLENLKTAGEYEIVLIVRDEGQNESEVTAKLIVNNVVTADLYINCTSSTSNETYNELTKFGIVDSEFTKTANRIYTFYLEEAEYTDLKNNNQNLNSVTYKDLNGNDITGVGVFNDDNRTLTITTVIDYDTLSSEVSGTIPTNAGELRDFYNNLGYSCSIGY